LEVIPIGRAFGKEHVIQDEVPISEGDILFISPIPPTIFKLDATKTAALTQSVRIIRFRPFVMDACTIAYRSTSYLLLHTLSV
jgi:hypothetical protein